MASSKYDTVAYYRCLYYDGSQVHANKLWGLGARALELSLSVNATDGSDAAHDNEEDLRWSYAFYIVLTWHCRNN